MDHVWRAFKCMDEWSYKVCKIFYCEKRGCKDIDVIYCMYMDGWGSGVMKYMSGVYGSGWSNNYSSGGSVLSANDKIIIVHHLLENSL